MEGEPELDNMRDEIAQTTIEIVRLIAKRNGLARRVGAVKKNVSLPVEDESVEAGLVGRVIRECDTVGLERSVGLKVLHTLIAEGKRVQGVTGEQVADSPMLALEKAVGLERQGKKLIRLDVGEPDFRPPKAVLQACSEALFSFKTHYTLPRGIPELRSALRSYLKRKNSFDAKDGELLVTPGGRFAVFSALASVLREGESAIVIDPNWPAFRQALLFIGARPIVISTELEDDWDLSIEDVKKAVRPDTKAMVVSYPCNPSGKVVDPAFFRELLGVANDNGLTVVSDEIYNEYSYKACPTVLAGGAERFVLTASFSKTWAMTGFRIGYAVSSEDVVSRMANVVSLMVTSVPEFIQYGAIEALSSERESQENRTLMKERIDVAGKELARIDSLRYSEPDGGMYYFPMLAKAGMNAAEFGTRLLNEKGVSVTPGTAFGDYPRHFRISLGQPKELLVDGIRRMGELLE
ncbi:MAG: aminotransferase class I/II-fold pyridoxal phosphate-dependent enzyme [Nitrososphaerales archaeon]|nr:aminotransferase class I/II-fold pyridoxal phosphate-dependent enzyme [Nitrososphaerales archaeon]